jgi:hypothetical protein
MVNSTKLHVPTRVTEPSNIRWFEKFDIRSSNIEPSDLCLIFDHRTGSTIQWFDRSNISIFDRSKGSLQVRYSMVRYSIDRIFDQSNIEYRTDSPDRILRYSIHRTIRLSNHSMIEYRISNSNMHRMVR